MRYTYDLPPTLIRCRHPETRNSRMNWIIKNEATRTAKHEARDKNTCNNKSKSSDKETITVSKCAQGRPKVAKVA